MMEFIMRLKKTTKSKACFKENMDRIGRVYLPIPLLNQMQIEDELILQLAPEKVEFPAGGYTARMVKDKETAKKIRFAEDISEKGELGIIYVSKEILANLGVEDKIAVRILSPEGVGDVSLAQV